MPVVYNGKVEVLISKVSYQSIISNKLNYYIAMYSVLCDIGTKMKEAVSP